MRKKLNLLDALWTFCTHIHFFVFMKYVLPYLISLSMIPTQMVGVIVLISICRMDHCTQLNLYLCSNDHAVHPARTAVTATIHVTPHKDCVLIAICIKPNSCTISDAQQNDRAAETYTSYARLPLEIIKRLYCGYHVLKVKFLKGGTLQLLPLFAVLAYRSKMPSALGSI